MNTDQGSSFAGAVNFHNQLQFLSGTEGQILPSHLCLFVFLLFTSSDVISFLETMEWAAAIVMTTSEGRGHWRIMRKAGLFFLWVLGAAT